MAGTSNGERKESGDASGQRKDGRREARDEREARRRKGGKRSKGTRPPARPFSSLSISLWVLSLMATIVGTVPLGSRNPNFVAVDCSDISKVGVLPIPKSCQKNDEEKEKRQMVEEKEVVVYQEEEANIFLPYCEVKLSRAFTHCGMFDHSSQIRPLEVMRPKRVSPDTCRRMVKTATWADDKGNNHSINVGGRTYLNYLEAGHLRYKHHEVSCQGQQVVIAGRVYDGILTMVDAQVTVLLKKARVRKDGQALELPEDGLVIHRDQIINHGWQAAWTSTNQGTFDLSEWVDPPLSTCNLKVLGRMRLQVINEETAFSNATVYWSKRTKIYLVRKEKKVITVCGEGDFYSTNLKGVFVEENAPKGEQVAKAPSRHINMVLLMTEMSDFVVQSLRLEIQTSAVHSRCLLLSHQASTQQTSSMPGANLGQMITLSGELAVVMQCRIVTATFRMAPGCYTDLPVDFNGTKYFLEPISRALKSHSTELPCSSTHQAFQDQKGRFFRAAPHLEEIDTPDDIMQETWDTGDSVAGKGIYSQEALDRAEKLYDWSRQREHGAPAPQQPEWQPEEDGGGEEGFHMKFPPWIPTAVQASIGLAGAVALCLLLTKAASMCGAAKGICTDLKMGALTARNIISTVCCTAYNEGVRSGRSRREALPNYMERREAVRRAETALQSMRSSRMLGDDGQEEGGEAQGHPAARHLTEL